MSSSQEEFIKLIHAKPKRKGKPKLATPKEMKAVWKTEIDRSAIDEK